MIRVRGRGKTMRTNYLMHHGILGQRWGVRRFQNKDGSYTSAGKDRYSVKGSREKADSEDSSKRKGLSDKQKDILKKVAIGTAIVGGAAFVTYMGVQMYKDGKFNPIIDKFKEMGKNSVKGFGDKIKFDKIEHEESIEERVLKVNETFYQHDHNPKNPLPDERNCGLCVIADEMRCKGYDVKALQNSDGMTFPKMVEYFKGIHDKSISEIPINDKLSEEALTSLETNSFTKEIVQEIKDRAVKIQKETTTHLTSNYPVGSRGGMLIPGSSGMGHWIKWEIMSDGSVDFVDVQNINNNPLMNFATTQHYKKSGSGIQVIRLDDLIPNNDIIDEVVTNYSSNYTKGGYNGAINRGDKFITKRS